MNIWRTNKPPIDEEVLVTVKDETGDSPYYYTAVGWCAGDFWVVDNAMNRQVIAWMDLPEPYMEESERCEHCSKYG